MNKLMDEIILQKNDYIQKCKINIEEIEKLRNLIILTNDELIKTDYDQKMKETEFLTADILERASIEFENEKKKGLEEKVKLIQERCVLGNFCNLAAIIKKQDDIRVSDILGLAPAKEKMFERMILPLKFPQIFTNRNNVRSIMIQGPSGSGKTSLLKAHMNEEKCKFLYISAFILEQFSDIRINIIKLIFDCANKQNKNLIIEDIDVICNESYCEEKGESLRRRRTEFLIQIDHFMMRNYYSNFLLLVTTSNPWNVDRSTRRRMNETIYTPLPTKGLREEKLRQYMNLIRNNLTDEDIEELADKSVK
jgi:SpoVK/Ycf46/Vps4 family AAA+-type ATPase